MNTIKLKIAIIVFFALVGYKNAQAQEEGYLEVDSIINNPGRYNYELVKIKGQITQYSPGDGQISASYTILGDYGSSINVTTTDIKPEVFKVYEIVGTVVIDPYTQEPYIIEKDKVLIKDTSGLNNPILIFGFFLGFIVLAALIIVLMARTNKASQSNTKSYADIAMSASSSGLSYDNDFKTIRIPTSTPKTLQFIPGKLVIISGEDKGKEFLISGYPTSRGNVVTIGREAATGERMYTHIQLTDKTVSRRQAELIQKGDKIIIKNLSETNFTSLDAIELARDEEREIKNNSVIRMGDLEFKYVI